MEAIRPYGLHASPELVATVRGGGAPKRAGDLHGGLFACIKRQKGDSLLENDTGKAPDD